jgi:hypothetical protein
MTYDLFAVAERLAPEPDQNGTTEQWVRHHAARSFAAWTAFRQTLGHRDPSLGLLAMLGVSSMHAAVALLVPDADVPRRMWELTPEAGAMNGEWEEWLTDILNQFGINPADINDEYVAGDFRSPSRAQEVAP